MLLKSKTFILSITTSKIIIIVFNTENLLKTFWENHLKYFLLEKYLHILLVLFSKHFEITSQNNSKSISQILTTSFAIIISISYPYPKSLL